MLFLLQIVFFFSMIGNDDCRCLDNEAPPNKRQQNDRLLLLLSLLSQLLINCRWGWEEVEQGRVVGFARIHFLLVFFFRA